MPSDVQPSMRVLLLIDSLGLGGKERQAAELVRGLLRVPGVHCRVECFDTDDFYLAELQRAGAAVELAPRRMRWDPTLLWRLTRSIGSFHPDVIHSNGLVSSFYALPLAAWWRVPLVNGSIRNAFGPDGFRWSIERALLRFSSYRVANSRAGLRSRRFAEDDPRNVVVYNGFDFTRLDRASHTPPIDVGDDVKAVVGMVAEFNRYKDYATFIDAARILAGRRRDIACVTIGDGPTLETCRERARGLSNVHFYGRRSDVEALVSTFDVGVLCSHVEGLSNSVMEYMAAAKPVVATDCGGMRELVLDGATGMLVPHGDPERVAEAIESLVDRPGVATRMGRAGRARLEDSFSFEQMVQGTLAVYAAATAKPVGAFASAAPRATQLPH